MLQVHNKLKVEEEKILLLQVAGKVSERVRPFYSSAKNKNKVDLKQKTGFYITTY